MPPREFSFGVHREGNSLQAQTSETRALFDTMLMIAEKCYTANMTLLEASRKTGISKQRLYRAYKKSALYEAHQGTSMIRINDEELSVLLEILHINGTSESTSKRIDETHQSASNDEVAFLREEVRALRSQIETLQKLLDQQQQLQLNMMRLTAPEDEDTIPVEVKPQPRKRTLKDFFGL